MTIENGMIVGAEAEYEAGLDKAEQVQTAIQNTIYYRRNEKISRKDAWKEVLDAVECAPPNFINYLQECAIEHDMMDFRATLSDILEWWNDEQSRKVVHNELGV